MKLIELLEIISCDNHVSVIDSLTSKVIAEYNGKDSINPIFNDCEVYKIGASTLYYGQIIEVEWFGRMLLNTETNEVVSLEDVYNEYMAFCEAGDKIVSDYEDFEEFLECATDMGGSLRWL